ncbi:hypothetical protein NDU88_007699 [Pleurodeles waltl]|uniref:Uncharacterized protein n=1 Tax=Pleurodeles waltl TaxID=8319 RepID=A0AAV7ST95_PLEWA|nr:hypothetical protein NDU88_007699 [Pleurodeles waltl]
MKAGGGGSPRRHIRLYRDQPRCRQRRRWAVTTGGSVMRPVPPRGTEAETRMSSLTDNHGHVALLRKSFSGRGLAAIHDGRLRAELRTAVGHAAGTVALEAHQKTPAAGAGVGVGGGRRPRRGGSALPGDAERSERSRLDACGRPLSRGLECGVIPARSDASPAGAQGRGACPPPLPAPWRRLACGPLEPATGRVAAYPSLPPDRSVPERGNGTDRHRGPEQQQQEVTRY